MNGDLESVWRELHEHRATIASISERLSRIDERVAALNVFREKQESKDQRIPVLLLGAISAGTAVVSILFQLWMTKGP